VGYDPLITLISDKAEVKSYIASKIGIEYCVPSIGICESYEDFLNIKLPKLCCIKPTHLSGEVIFKNGELYEKDLKKIKNWFSTNYYYLSREKNYRYLKPRLIIEDLVFGSQDNEDLKFFCYKQKLRFIQVDLGRWKDHSRIYFDRDWKKLEFSISKKQSNIHYPEPINFKKMKSLAEEISKDFEFIRVDFYTNNKEIYIGELTNLPEAGNGNFIPRDSEELASIVFFE
jgi:hypothetical protein